MNRRMSETGQERFENDLAKEGGSQQINWAFEISRGCQKEAH